MLSIVGRGVAGARASSGRVVARMSQKRFEHHVHYAPDEPLSRYAKWIGGIAAIVGLITYDRIYSDGAIRKLVTPKSNSEEIAKQRERFVDQQLTEQDRAITLLQPPGRSQIHETFSTRPVPVGAARGEHTSEVIDPETLEERRQRTRVFK